MGWKQNLLSLGSLAAMPFTGGASAAGFLGGLGKAAPYFGALSGVLGGAAGARGQGKVAEATIAQEENRNQQALYDIITRNLLSQGQAGERKAAFELNAPTTRFRQGLGGTLAANAQDFQWAPHPKIRSSGFTGGARPSMFSQGGRQLGQQFADLATSRLGKDTFDVPRLPAPPEMERLPRSGWLDKLLGIGAGATGFLGALGTQSQTSRPPLPFQKGIPVDLGLPNVRPQGPRYRSWPPRTPPRF